MHIIGGALKGIHLTNVKKITNYTRPTSARLRENLFNILTHNFPLLLKGHFVDCFAGTGSIGLEALSRGAQHVTFVEKKICRFAKIKKKY